jgi:hypothetical protein
MFKKTLLVYFASLNKNIQTSVSVLQFIVFFFKNHHLKNEKPCIPGIPRNSCFCMLLENKKTKLFNALLLAFYFSFDFWLKLK